MSTDRELLELAAKAVGLTLDYESYTAMNLHAPMAQRGGQGAAFRWNPLTDDGDALRLAASLGFSIHVLAQSIAVSRPVDGTYVGGWHPRGLDDEADYRRAIVIGAAALGKAMP